MKSNGFGTGFEMNTFTERVGASGKQRLAVIIFWRGGGSSGFSPRVVRTATGKRASLPIRLLLYPLLPIVWVADKITGLRRRRRRPPVVTAEMSPAVRAAQESARYESGSVTIGSHVHSVPPHATLAVFVEDDPAQKDGLSVTTHRIATEPYTPAPTPNIDPAVRERIRAATDEEARREVMREAAMTLARQHSRGEGQAFQAVHRDPVCREFTRRASGEED